MVQSSFVFIIYLAVFAVGFFLASFLIYFGIVSLKENEALAARRAFLMALVLPLPFLLTGIAGLFLIPDSTLITAVGILLLAIVLLVTLALLLPFGNQIVVENDLPEKRIDERDIMFARNLLVAGTERFKTYYERHPDKKSLDDKFRKRPGLMQPGALYYDPFTVAAAEASFKTVAAFHSILDEEKPVETPVPVDDTKMTLFLKRWAKKLGAVSVGATEL